MFANKFGEHNNVCCGLVQLIKKGEEWQPPTKAPIPLISVNVNASVVHAVAQVEVTQVYVNKEENPIEAIYYFPVNSDGAVTHFQAELDGRVIKGTVKPQEEAKEAYDKAVENNTTAFLGEETKADIFKVRVGFLKPGSQVKVIIGYVTEVKNEPGTNAIRFYIPTTIAPRYVSPTETDDKAQDLKDMRFSSTSPAPLTLKVAVSLLGGIKTIECPTHEVKINKAGPIPQNEAWHKAIVELSGETTNMDKDFVLNIVPEDIHKPRLYSEKNEDGTTAVMVHLVPSFKLDEQKVELIFVLDRSGSMMGQSIELAKKALLLFLHSMPADCYFNVIGFGSTYEFLFPESVKYDDGSLKKAIDHAKKLDANLGGTEILSPLQEIYKKPGKAGYLRQIFILTDGEVSNTDGVLGIAQANAHKARVFALGIGDGASHYLVGGVAKAGGGTSAFVTYNESIDKKVLNQLKNGLQPSLIDIELEWEGVTLPVEDKPTPPPVINKEKTLLGYNKPVEASPTDNVQSKKNNQSPKRIPPVYDGSQLLVFGLFKDDCPKSVSIKAQSPDGPLTLKVEHSSENDVGKTGMLHRLAAVKLVRELELEVAALHFQGLEDISKQEAKLKKEIVEIACQNGITSKFTSFVAIDVKDDKPSAENWVMETRNVPTQFAHGWHGGVSFGAPQARCGALPMSVRTKSKRSVGSSFFRSSGSGLFGSAAAPSPPMFSKPRSCATLSADPTAFSFSASTPPILGDVASFDQPRCAALSFRGEAAFGEQSEIMDYEEEADHSQTPLMQLIGLQSFNGSFTLDEKLAAIVGKSLKELKDGAGKNGQSEIAFATALAIAFFVSKLGSEKDVWDLVVKKAKKWLAGAVQNGSVDTIVQNATTFLGA